MQKIVDVILLQKKELENWKNKFYVERDTNITGFENDMIKVITGPRRAGKSLFAINQLKFQKIGYVNFDDEVLVKFDAYNMIIETVIKVYNSPDILFFDEIQNVDKWELLVNRLKRQGYKIVLTGSNAKLLSRELSTHLTGRYLEYLIFPFTFKEYIRYYSSEGELTSTEKQLKFSSYVNNGGYPEPLVNKIDYRSYLKTLFDSIILKDVVLRYNIRSAKSLESIADFLLANVGNPLSYNNVTKFTDIKSVHTVIKYIKFLEETFLFFQINKFSYKIKEQLKSNKKIYVVDTGFLKARAFTFSENIGRLYENIAASALKRKELNGKIELFYYKDFQNYETDFVVKQGNNITQLIQVCYNVSDMKTKKREIRGLIHASKDLNCNNLKILTNNFKNQENIEWYDDEYIIDYLPLWEWLLEIES